MPRRSIYTPETEDERKRRVLRETRELTNLLKTKLPEMLRWEALDEGDLERVERHLGEIKSVLPKQEREHGEWSEVYKVLRKLDHRASLISWLVKNQTSEYVSEEDMRKLNAAVEVALDALAARKMDDAALTQSEALRNVSGRTPEEAAMFIAKADELESRRRWSGGGRKAQSYFDYHLAKARRK